MRSLAAALALALLASAARADENGCYTPSFLVEPGHALTRVAEAVRQDRRLPVLIVSGSPSQVGGTKGRRSYPTHLENALRKHLPGVEVSVEVRAKARRAATEALEALPAAVEETKPALVVWQVGTVDILRQVPIYELEQAARDGIRHIVDRGADAVLMDMQYSPRTDRWLDYASYLDVIRDAAENAKVPLFDRYEIMRYWNVSGTFDLGSLRDDGLYEKVHVCIGELLADFILRGAGLKESKGIGG